MRITSTVRFAVKSITGTDNANNEVTMPGPNDATKVVTFNFEKQFYPLVQVNPECGGKVVLSGPEDYTSNGTSLSATATPAAGLVFAGGRATRHGGSPHLSTRKRYIGLDGRIATAVENLTGGDIDDRGHALVRW